MMTFNLTDINNLISILQNTNRNNPLTAIQIETSLHQQFGFPISGNQQRTRVFKIMESAIRLKDTWNRNNLNNQI
jgi:hypothetical protein